MTSSLTRVRSAPSGTRISISIGVPARRASTVPARCLCCDAPLVHGCGLRCPALEGARCIFLPLATRVCRAILVVGQGVMRRDGAQPVSRPFAALPACMTVLMRLRVGRWDVTWLLDPEQQKRPRVAVQFVFSPLSAESFSEMVKKTIQIYLRVQISSTRCLFL